MQVYNSIFWRWKLDILNFTIAEPPYSPCSIRHIVRSFIHSFIVTIPASPSAPCHLFHRIMKSTTRCKSYNKRANEINKSISKNNLKFQLEEHGARGYHFSSWSFSFVPLDWCWAALHCHHHGNMYVVIACYGLFPVDGVATRRRECHTLRERNPTRRTTKL